MRKRANSGINPSDLADRISLLPDSILSLILSFIPTNNAVATSVLSKRWKSLWKSVHNLDFNLDFGRYSGYCMRYHTDWFEDKEMKFACFVNHVLLLHDGGFLNKFSLVWNPMRIPSHVISWINTAITRNINELYLCIDKYDDHFEIPSSVFSCLTLKSLELGGNMFVCDSAAVCVCLPKLQRLKLVSVYFQSDVAFQKLISGCPILNFLHVQMDIDNLTEYSLDNGTNIFTFIISSTSLRCFILEVESDFIVWDEVSDCSLELEAPSLVYLRLVGYVPKIFVRGSLSSLVEAQLNLRINESELSDDVSVCNSLVEAIRAFNCAKSLTLSEYLLSALSRATIDLSTKFNRLTKLTTEANCCCSSLQDFIQSSDILEVLIVNKDSPCPGHENDDYIHMPWTTPVEIPRCLSNSLRTVEFDGYCGFDFERDMIRYMLRHGSALEFMTLNCYIKRDGVKLELVDEIRDFPRKTPSCRVNFFSDIEDISFGLQG